MAVVGRLQRVPSRQLDDELFLGPHCEVPSPLRQHPPSTLCRTSYSWTWWMQQKPLVFELIPGHPSNQAILFTSAVDWLQPKPSPRPTSPPVREAGSVPMGSTHPEVSRPLHSGGDWQVADGHYCEPWLNPSRCTDQERRVSTRPAEDTVKVATWFNVQPGQVQSCPCHLLWDGTRQSARRNIAPS